ncbi:lysine 2,3-aminomutase [Streptomyces sp. V3I8]|uniref:lysine-2,3-aminomutase-like protein n=1 Tax=Streptomyces sp. V3I8 TaxID=3042279 RepID=UPI002789316F|nr:lysine-2,3-aminomutase-like protein [Streptomyces sp. V3I8]MDQ1041577.1 lysine 2,3-aminomutase [Streptomyces sp. V3I8]
MRDERRTTRTVKGLVQAGLAAQDERAGIERVASRYAISVTATMREQITGGADDPVARQFVPDPRELETQPHERDDPIGDGPFTPLPGITHRYPDRVLLKPLHLCPVYCRFCFRREMVGPGHGVLGEGDLSRALGYIRDDPQIWEVILTGGDPLMLSPARLRRIVAELDAIAHVGVVRVHTRVPVVAPERITDELLDALTADTPVWTVIHCNHRQELGEGALSALHRLTDRGFPLLSQSVLLKGVNDTAQALEDLFRTLVRHRVKPYYLHHGDLAPGTSHFRTTVAAGQELTSTLRGAVSGLCQPTYVLDIPGGHGKVPIGRGYLDEHPDGYLVTDPRGDQHIYPPTVESLSPRTTAGEPSGDAV